MLERSRTNDAIKELEAIFEVLLNIKVFMNITRIKEVRGARNKIIDIVYEAYPDKDFFKSVIAANKRQKDGRDSLASKWKVSRYFYDQDGRYDPQER